MGVFLFFYIRLERLWIMSNNANRFSLSSSSVLNLQGLTLEAAIAEAEDCFCSGCGGREGQYINGYRITWLSPFGEDLRFCFQCAQEQDLTFCQCGEIQRPFERSCERCEEFDTFFCQCGSRVEENSLCRECQKLDEELLIQNYSYKPEAIFIGKGQLYLGVELEVLASRQTAKKLRGVASYQSYFKKDSSIRGEGFEIVTHPMSLAKQLDYWKRVIKTVGGELAANSSCGMHVHLSRQPLNQMQIGKILVFLNNPENELWIDLLAGRPANYYCQKAEKKIEDALSPQSRYEALNLMNNETIEFRLFASSNELQEICSRIEFCHAVTNYCKDCDLESLDWDCFVEWLYISSGENMYHYLKEWVETTPEPEVKA